MLQSDRTTKRLTEDSVDFVHQNSIWFHFSIPLIISLLVEWIDSEFDLLIGKPIRGAKSWKWVANKVLDLLTFNKCSIIAKEMTRPSFDEVPLPTSSNKT